MKSLIYCSFFLIDQPHSLGLPCEMLDVIFLLDQTESIGPILSEKMKNLTKEVMDRHAHMLLL